MPVKKKMGDMPHSLESEQALLGCLILDPNIQFEILSSIKEEDFYTESHKYIFNAMLNLVNQNQTVDLVTLTDALEKQGVLSNVGGMEYIAQLTSVIPSSANYKRYFDIVTRDSLLRKLIVGSSDIIDNCMQSTDKDGALSYAEKTIFDLGTESENKDMVKIGTVIPDVMTRLDELTKDKNSARGIKTQFRGLDNLLNGVHNSDLMILAARPAVGKTSFAMNIIENIALQGYSCAVFSLEMSKEQLVQRMMCSVAGVSMSNASKGIMSQADWLKIVKAKKLLSNAKIYIDDSALISPSQILSKCRRLKRKGGLDIVMIDYIQLMTSNTSRKSDNRQNEIAEISRSLKILAKEVNVPVLALSQLSRAVESRKGRPMLSDLRESGAIEQDADIVMFIHRPDKGATEKDLAEGKIQKNVAEILVEKHRNGPVGMVKLYFKEECTKFVNLNEETGEPDEESASKPVKVRGYEDLPTEVNDENTGSDMEIQTDDQIDKELYE